MSKLTSNAQTHLKKMSESKKKLIRNRIANQPKINPFVVDNGYMYFLVDVELVCVELQETNGVFVLWFDGQIIEFNCTTGNCYIFSFSRNCLEYFSVGNHYENVDSQKGLYSFLYKLLIQEKINRVAGRIPYSLRFFFKENNVVGYIEKTGGKLLKSPNDCLSLQEMLCGIHKFVHAQLTASFMKIPCFRQIKFLQQSQCYHLSIAEKRGLQLFYSSSLDIRFKSMHMISIIVMKLLTIQSNLMNRNFQNNVLEFLKTMFWSILKRICWKFIQNPNGLRQATDMIDDLLSYYSVKSKLEVGKGNPTMTASVGEMIGMATKRIRDTEQRRDEYFAELNRIEKEKRERHASIQEYQNGIGEVNAVFEETIYLQEQLKKFCEDSPEKKPRLQ